MNHDILIKKIIRTPCPPDNYILKISTSELFRNLQGDSNEVLKAKLKAFNSDFNYKSRDS
jgi:hypothetical protein